ncbi:hypothetical protein BVX99_03410, partial [bacterium F16]
ETSPPAIAPFKGDAFVGLNAFSLSRDDLAYAQSRLVMLSGLYGVLRPLDLMQPYRLEMGGKFVPPGARSMLDFWKPRITAFLQQAVNVCDTPMIVNLASHEYSAAVDFNEIGVPVFSPRFLETKNGRCKIVSSFAKKARGLMTRWLILNRIQGSAELTGFCEGGYAFSPEHSTAREPTFVR